MHVKEICPYFFELKEKFLERAGIKPSTMTDEFFGGGEYEVIENANNFDVPKDRKNSDSSFVNMRAVTMTTRIKPRFRPR
jgi:hypothetical protein